MSEELKAAVERLRYIVDAGATVTLGHTHWRTVADIRLVLDARDASEAKVREQAEEIERLKRRLAVLDEWEQGHEEAHQRAVDDCPHEEKTWTCCATCHCVEIERRRKAEAEASEHESRANRWMVQAQHAEAVQRIAREALRPAAPEAKESDCTCGEQWPCPLHGGPPAAPEPTPSEKCPYCGLTTCRYGADPTSTCHAKGDSCRCSEQPDLPLGHEFVAGHPHPAYQSYCALRGIFGLCGQPESAHRRKP